MRRARLAGQCGFTLIEVMVVVVILGILASIVVPRIMGRPDEARLVKVQADLRAIASALELYRLDNFAYPTTDQGLQALTERPNAAPVPQNWKAGGYLDRLPADEARLRRDEAVKAADVPGDCYLIRGTSLSRKVSP